MKDLFLKYKNIALVIIIAVVVFFLYSIFFTGDGSTDSLLTSESGGRAEEAVVGKEFLAVLLEIRSLDLDESLFSDKPFLLLRDFSQEVEPQPTGRSNPFAVIGNDQEVIIPEDTGDF